MEFNARWFAMHNIKPVSMTQELGHDPTAVMMRQIMALFDEYYSNENAKHALGAMKESSSQG